MQGYVHDIQIGAREQSLIVDAKCYRSMKKSAQPHLLRLDIGVGMGQITDAYCLCKAGYVYFGVLVLIVFRLFIYSSSRIY